jgi:hypothetical protein
MLMKNSSELMGIEVATFRLVVQCINKLRHQQRAPTEMSTKKIS